ncbi:hypothetical protein [Methanoregula sp.]|uniref:hypothetical protein n=1 Tax=Methanoregula sp. TaxID=2052170 RepID=UPI003C71A74A
MHKRRCILALTLREEHGLALFLILVFLIPCALIIVVSVELPYSTVSGEPVKNAIRVAGVTVTSTKNVTWNLPGATGGKTCVLSDAAGNNDQRSPSTALIPVTPPSGCTMPTRSDGAARP